MSEHPKPHHPYRVVGFRPNGSRVVMGSGLTVDEARRARDALANANIFALIHVETDSDEPTGPVVNGLTSIARLSNQPVNPPAPSAGSDSDSPSASP